MSAFLARHPDGFSIILGSPALGLHGIIVNATMMSMRVLGDCDKGLASDVMDAIVWAAGGVIDGVDTNLLPARIISKSFTGRGGYPSYLQSAVHQAVRLGSILVAATGNQAEDAVLYFPGNCDGVVSVGASTVNGALAPYSNWNATLYAPGGDSSAPIAVEAMNRTLKYVVGTSLSTVHLAGMLVLSSLKPSAPNNSSMGKSGNTLTLAARHADAAPAPARSQTCCNPPAAVRL